MFKNTIFDNDIPVTQEYSFQYVELLGHLNINTETTIKTWQMVLSMLG